MIDIHIHILPGLDDGAESWEEALEMAEMTVESGVRVIAATPHANLPGQVRSREAEVCQEQLDTFRRLLKKEKIPLTVCRGMELFHSENLAEHLKRKRLWTLNGTRYSLVEFAPDTEAYVVYQIIIRLQNTGFWPVIAHPERYLCIQRVPAHAYEWYQMGAVLQIDQGSVLGRFGNETEDAARLLVRHRLAGAAASDAHRSYTRAPRLSQLWEILADEYGKDCPALLLRENPARILQGKPVFRRQPLPFEYAKFS